VNNFEAKIVSELQMAQKSLGGKYRVQQTTDLSIPAAIIIFFEDAG
jgi:hypothetical protein